MEIRPAVERPMLQKWGGGGGGRLFVEYPLLGFQGKSTPFEWVIPTDEPPKWECFQKIAPRQIVVVLLVSL